jgi:hypothetical protein
MCQLGSSTAHGQGDSACLQERGIKPFLSVAYRGTSDEWFPIFKGMNKGAVNRVPQFPQCFHRK